MVSFECIPQSSTNEGLVGGLLLYSYSLISKSTNEGLLGGGVYCQGVTWTLTTTCFVLVWTFSDY